MGDNANNLGFALAVSIFLSFIVYLIAEIVLYTLTYGTSGAIIIYLVIVIIVYYSLNNI